MSVTSRPKRPTQPHMSEAELLACVIDLACVFGWLYPKAGLHVIDAVWCSIFRNESARLSSDIILEAETLAHLRWPELPRFATYIKPTAVLSTNPGYCFKVAGYSHIGNSTRGYHLLVKEEPR